MVARTKSKIACFAAPAFHDGNASPEAAVCASAKMGNSVPARTENATKAAGKIRRFFWPGNGFGFMFEPRTRTTDAGSVLVHACRIEERALHCALCVRGTKPRSDPHGFLVVVVELVLEVLSGLSVGSGLIVEHVHLAGVLVDDRAARHFLRALGHCRLMARFRYRAVGLLDVAGLEVDPHGLAVIELRHPHRLRLTGGRRLGLRLPDRGQSGGSPGRGGEQRAFGNRHDTPPRPSFDSHGTGPSRWARTPHHGTRSVTCVATGRLLDLRNDTAEIVAFRRLQWWELFVGQQVLQP